MNNPFTQKTIRIECSGATTVDIDAVNWFQGKLKTFTDEDYENMKALILKLGFSDPLSIWVDTNGKIWTHDGHGRILTLKRMRQEEGYEIPLLPASHVFAKSVAEAKAKLLANDSRFGKVDAVGLTDFKTEENEDGSKFDEFEEIEEFLDFPEIDFETGETEDSPGNTGIKEQKEVECPHCHLMFTPSK